MATISPIGCESQPPSDAELLQQAAAGEPSAFDELVRRHEPRVRRLAFRLLGWRDADAEDVVQDVFLALLKRLGSFRADSKLSTWLTAVTLNRCRSHRRRRMLRLRWMRSQIAPPVATSSDQMAQRDEIDAQVRRAVSELSAADREVIVLFYLEQMPVADIAVLLGARNNAIEVRLHRARHRLKEKLARLVPDSM